MCQIERFPKAATEKGCPYPTSVFLKDFLFCIGNEVEILFFFFYQDNCLSYKLLIAYVMKILFGNIGLRRPDTQSGAPCRQ